MMKDKKSLWSGVSVLIVLVLAITALARGQLQVWLFAAAFAAWGIWAAVWFLVPYVKAQAYRYKARRIRKQCEPQEEKTKFEIPDLSDSAETFPNASYQRAASAEFRFSELPTSITLT